MDDAFDANGDGIITEDEFDIDAYEHSWQNIMK